MSISQNKLVSVIIPTYKRPISLRRTIDSVLSQTYRNVEVIVVDDNDPNTPERKETEVLMDSYGGETRVKYIKHHKNLNGSTARNTGWKNSLGEYVTFLDDDDEISPQKISLQVECLNVLDKTWGACYTDYHIIGKNGLVQHSATKRVGDVYIQALMRTFYVGSGSNLLLRKSVVEEIRGYDESFLRNQDIEFMARVFEKYKVARVPIDLLTIHQDEERIIRPLDFIENISTFYLEKFSDRLNELPSKYKKNVISVISVERARVAVAYKEYKYAYSILKQNRVSFYVVFRYICYLIHRYLTKKSYGFYIE